MNKTIIKKGDFILAKSLLFTAFIFLLLGAILFLLLPKSIEAEVFSPTRKRTSVSGIVEAHREGKSVTRIYVYSQLGPIYQIDCLFNKPICHDQKEGSQIKIKADLVQVKHQFYWPVSATFSTGEHIDENGSKLLLKEFLMEREREYHMFFKWSATLLMSSLIFFKIKL